MAVARHLVELVAHCLEALLVALLHLVLHAVSGTFCDGVVQLLAVQHGEVPIVQTAVGHRLGGRCCLGFLLLLGGRFGLEKLVFVVLRCIVVDILRSTAVSTSGAQCAVLPCGGHNDTVVNPSRRLIYRAMQEELPPGQPS